MCCISIIGIVIVIVMMTDVSITITITMIMIRSSQSGKEEVEKRINIYLSFSSEIFFNNNKQ
jgi:hypothetical protein